MREIAGIVKAAALCVGAVVVVAARDVLWLVVRR